MSESMMFFACPDCGHLHAEMLGELDDDAIRWLCPRCRHQYGVTLNEGQLDLGIIKSDTTTGISVDFPDEGPDVES